IERLPADLAALDNGEAVTKPAQQPSEQVQTQGLTLQQLTADERDRLGLGDNGIRVSAVETGAGAAAGLRVGDVLLADGKHRVQPPAASADRVKGEQGPLALLVWRHGERLYLALQPD